MGNGSKIRLTVIAALILLGACCSSQAYAQKPNKDKKGKKDKTEQPAPPQLQRTYRVEGGVKNETTVYPDSLGNMPAVPVGGPGAPGAATAVGGAPATGSAIEAIGTEGVQPAADSVALGTVVPADSTAIGTPAADSLSLGGTAVEGVGEGEMTPSVTEGGVPLPADSAFTTDPALPAEPALSEGGPGEDIPADSLAETITLTENDFLEIYAPQEWTAADSLAADSLKLTLDELAIYRELRRRDALELDDEDYGESLVFARTTRRHLARADRISDTTRINKIFRDSIPISRLAWYQAVLPGFGQLYNSQAWKIPILYGTVGASTAMWMKERKDYNKYKREYDYLVARDPNRTDFRSEIEDVQRKMNRHNTLKQLWMFGAIGSYLYFIGDAAINYPGATNSVKKATTLSTIFPGAGQIYNGSYWKVPIVIGGIATFAMMIDWNNRGYKRYKTAYTLLTDDDPTTNPENALKNMSADALKDLKQSFRRNRDLCIILAGVFYVVNIIDAHVDAHLKSYDVSDDLSMSVEPMMTDFYTQSKGGSRLVGLSLVVNF